MELDIGWILLGLPAAFALGWLASRMDLRQMRLEGRRAPKAYFKGLNHLLNEQQDAAIDAFIEAVQHDPDTSELHFALGNLFRRRGEYERAVRVHEHLASRGDLPAKDRHRALHALALDYLKAGLLDRATEALSRLEGTQHETEARHALLSIHEKTRDWEKASAIASQLHAQGQGSFEGRIAHYECESALALAQRGSRQEALVVLENALASCPGSARPGMELSSLLAAGGDNDRAWSVLFETASRCPQAFPLMANAYAHLAIATNHVSLAVDKVKAAYAELPSLDLLECLVTLESHGSPTAKTPSAWYVSHLEREPSLVAASKWIAGEKFEHEQFHPLVQRALEHAVKPLTRFRCAACGFTAARHFWQCPGCQTWDSYPPRRVEEL
jgi:lipopolysaccharide assembly protein B